MNIIKSLSFHLIWIVMVNCLFLSEIVKSESISSDNEVVPVNAYLIFDSNAENPNFDLK